MKNFCRPSVPDNNAGLSAVCYEKLGNFHANFFKDTTKFLQSLYLDKQEKLVASHGKVLYTVV